MKFQTTLGLLAALATSVIAEEKVHYDGYKVFRIEAHDDVADIHKQLEGLATTSVGCGGETDHVEIAIAPEDLEAFAALGLDAKVINEDLGEALAEEGPVSEFYGDENTIEARQAGLPAASWFTAYRPWAEHATFFNQIQAALPSNSEIFNVGQSFQGRTIYGIHLWGPNGKGSRPAIVFHGTVHAREWISAPVVEYITRELAAGYLNNDASVRAWFGKYDFYFIPFVNPDGFVYTQSTNRLWRKNRQTRSGTTCVGTDGNRNWNFNWGLTGGASTNPCDETYKGLAAGDTPEIRALQTFTQGLRTRGVKLFIDWHSYGQYILLPYGYSCSARAPNHATQMSVAGGFSSAIRAVSGTSFTYGPSCSTLYATTGSSPDYHSGAINAEFSWTVELRPGPNSSNGFVLPASQIAASGAEQWAGIRYVLNTI
ncbi:hypothetical protein VDGD_05115 [Verticillium dahliae]|nr:hypothetical protein VdG1_04036 [Verticillium dahliae VDG1]RBR02515.1 hypothetical protein VDGD_05115 [Verticillium dahliae]